MKRLIAVVVIVILAASLIPAVSALAADSGSSYFSKQTDPSTINGWEQFFGTKSGNTANAGGVWVDKSVFTDEAAFLNAGNVDIGEKIDDNNFLISLSAIASNKSITQLSQVPVDVVFVLDLSGSMSSDQTTASPSTAVRSLVSTLNATIGEINALNENNRVGVVFFNGSSLTYFSSYSEAKQILPIGRYSYNGQDAGDYFITRKKDGAANTDNDNTVWEIALNSGVSGASGPVETANACDDAAKGSGTYMQAGFFLAQEMFAGVSDKVIDIAGMEVERQPVLVFMGDGGPTAATSDFNDLDGTSWTAGDASSGIDTQYGFSAGQTVTGYANMGASRAQTTYNKDEDIGKEDYNKYTTRDVNALTGFVTQLTAAWSVNQIDAAYAGREPLVYTVSLGSGLGNMGEAILDPQPQGTKDDVTPLLDTLWTNYVSSAGDYVITTNSLVDTARMTEGYIDADMRTTTGRGWSYNISYFGKAPYADSYTIPKDASITMDDRDYVTTNFTAAQAGDLPEEFHKIVEEISRETGGAYATNVDAADGANMSGFLEFYDTISKYMEVKNVEGILSNGVLHTGEMFADKLDDTSEDGFGTRDDPTALGDQFVFAVKERLGIADTLTARDLIRDAYGEHQLLPLDHTTGEFSNYIGWYAAADKTYLGFWDGREDTAAANAPAGAEYAVKSYGMLGDSGDSNLLYSYIDVCLDITGSGIGETKMIWGIPASLLPHESYDIEFSEEALDDNIISAGESASLKITDAQPLRLLYEVGLRDEYSDPAAIANKMKNESEDSGAYSYDEASGTYTFYTNKWSAGEVAPGHDHHHAPITHIGTTSYFEPNNAPDSRNERYYYTEDTPVYVKDSGGNYVLYEGDRPDVSGEYYRSYLVFEFDPNAVLDGNVNAAAKYEYERISSAALGAAVQHDGSEAWYIPEGQIHEQLADYQLKKASNNTGTVDYSNFPTIGFSHDVSDHHFASAILGNNGSISVRPAQGILLKKSVDADKGEEFSFTIAYTGSGTVGGYTVKRVFADGTDDTVSAAFDAGNRATVTLKAGEELYIYGIPAGEYTITEAASRQYAFAGAAAGGTETDENPVSVDVFANGFSEVTFYNVLGTSAEIPVVKKMLNLSGGDMGADGFTFTLEDSSGKKTEAVSDTSGSAVFVLSYTADDTGTHNYKLYENNGGMDGVSYSTLVYDVAVDVAYDGAANDITADMRVSLDGSAVEAAVFENAYTPPPPDSPDIPSGDTEDAPGGVGTGDNFNKLLIVFYIMLAVFSAALIFAMSIRLRQQSKDE